MTATKPVFLTVEQGRAIPPTAGGRNASPARRCRSLTTSRPRRSRNHDEETPAAERQNV